ncbi:MAG: glycosyl hydrolase, partial [Verrucomicrobiae bacterium]
MIFKTDCINNPARNRDAAGGGVNLPVRRYPMGMVSSLMEFMRLMVLALAAGFYFSAASGFAASVTWGTPTTISSDTDVITSGSLVYAYTGGTNGATVNGVAFTVGNSGTAWGGNVSLSGFGSPYSAYGGTNAPWTNLSIAYQTVLQGGAYGGATTGTVTLKGLTAEHSYSAQIWVNDARSTGSGRSAVATGANTVTLDYNNLNASGGVGQYVIGSFVANSTNQTFNLTSSSSVQLNAINLRDNGAYVFSPTRVNLAKYQPVIADSTNGSQTSAFITDGLVTDTSSWQSGNTKPHWAEVDFPFPVAVGSAQLVMGLDNVSPPTGFSLQYLTNGIWTNVPGTTVSGNTNKERNIVFSSPVTATAFRFYDSADATVNLRELALYPPNGPSGFSFGTDFSIDLARKQPAFATANTLGGWPLLAADGMVDPSTAWETTLVGSNSLQINLQFTNKIGSAHLYSGLAGVRPLANFVLQYWTGSAWANIPGGSVTGNNSSALVIPFITPVTTTKVQLVFTNNGISAVQELCIFSANNSSGYPLGTGIVSNTPVAADYDTFSDSYYYLSNSAAGLVVTESNAVPVLGAPGITNPASQYQVLLNYDTGTYRLRNRATGLCLSGTQLSTNAGTALVDETYSALPDQDWYLQSTDGTNFNVVNQFSGLALATQGGVLVQNVQTNSPTQFLQISLAKIFPKKGIAGSWGGYPVKFAANWTYGWWYTSDPNLPGVNYFPMDPDNWYRGGTVAGNLWSFQPGWRRAGYSLNIMGYNEPDQAGQANLDATNGAIYYMNDHNLDLPLAGPAPASLSGTWLPIFFGYITNWGCRVDYLPGHEYPGNNSSASSGIWINPLQTAYNTWGIPMWMTEFSIVDWAGNQSWTEEDNYNALAEFMWRAESLPWLRKYSLFLFTADTTNNLMAPNPWTATTPAPRSNSFDTNGNLTPFGELYAAWDNDANVETNKLYYIHNSGTRKRLQNTLSTTANATDIRTSDVSVQWTLQPVPSSSQYYVVSSLDGRRLSYNGSSVGYVAAGTTGTNVQWSLTANQYGWFYLSHPASSKRLQLAFNNTTSVATFTMATGTTTTTAVQWRFIVPLPPTPSVWTGASSTSWMITNNWVAGNAPSASESVTFNSLSTAHLATVLNSNYNVFAISLTTPVGPVSIGGANTLTVGSGGIDLSSASQNLTVTAPLVLGAIQSWIVTNGATLSVNGGMSGSGAVNIAGGGIVSLGGTATYTGDTTVFAGGTLQMAATNVLPNGVGVGNVNVSGTLDLNGTAQAINVLNGSGVVDNTAVGPATLTITNDSFSGVIQNSGGALALVKIGTGSATLSGTNTYRGGTTINGGNLVPSNANAIGIGTLTVNSGGIFYPTAATMIFSNPVTLNGGTLEIGGANGHVLTHWGLVTVTTNSTIKSDGSTYGIYLNGGVDMGNGGYTLSSYNSTAGNGNQITGIIGANGMIMNSGIGNLWIGGSNTFAGTFRATNSGPLIFQTVYALQNATLDMNAADIGAVSFSANVIIGALTGSRNLN